MTQLRTDQPRRGWLPISAAAMLCVCWGACIAKDEPPAPSKSPANLPSEKAETLPPLAKEWTRLTPPKSPERVWINAKSGQVAVDGNVCLTRGYLELFACTTHTKEHESVVALDAKAQTLHFALLGIGAKKGSPARWAKDASYTPATGQTVEVIVEWMKEGKPTRVKAQHWIRDLKTKKPMTHEWVFAGSSTWTDPETKKKYYRADGGEVICVSNFPVAMMDLPIESSQANEELAFEALTEHIPKRRTPVRVYLVPKAPMSSTSSAADAEQKAGKQETAPAASNGEATN